MDRNIVPEYMFPELQGLPDEFRRLAWEERMRWHHTRPDDDSQRAFHAARERTWNQAAQMLEERLNG